MKLPLILIISGLCAYVSCRQEIVWGNADWNVKELGTETIVVSSSWFEVKQYNFTFPRNGGTTQITGIRHVDYKSHPVSVRFVYGGLGYVSASIEVTSQRGHGINSTFTFYGQR